MRSALTTLTEILESTYMSSKDVDHLLARSLQEEASE